MFLRARTCVFSKQPQRKFKSSQLTKSTSPGNSFSKRNASIFSVFGPFFFWKKVIFYQSPASFTFMQDLNIFVLRVNEKLNFKDRPKNRNRIQCYYCSYFCRVIVLECRSHPDSDCRLYPLNRPTNYQLYLRVTTADISHFPTVTADSTQ